MGGTTRWRPPDIVQRVHAPPGGALRTSHGRHRKTPTHTAHGPPATHSLLRRSRTRLLPRRQPKNVRQRQRSPSNGSVLRVQVIGCRCISNAHALVRTLPPRRLGWRARTFLADHMRQARPPDVESVNRQGFRTPPARELLPEEHDRVVVMAIIGPARPHCMMSSPSAWWRRLEVSDPHLRVIAQGKLELENNQEGGSWVGEFMSH